MKFRKIVSVLLLFVYAAYFASTNLCYHTHLLANGKIVHSHPFWGAKGHSHSSGQLHTIDLLCHTPYSEGEEARVQEILPAYFIFLEFAPVAVDLLRISSHLFSLRAPPVLW